MNEPTLEALTKGLERLDRKIQLLQWLVVLVLVVVAIWYWIVPSQVGRYQSVPQGDSIVFQTDTLTGELWVFKSTFEGGYEAVKRLPPVRKRVAK